MSKLNKKIKTKGGFTYVELIVVLSIFSLLSTVAIFNYGAFQDKIDIKNLASDIALQVVQAQKSSLNGQLLPVGFTGTPPWKPSYGVYFTSVTDLNADNKSFIYFADLNNSSVFDGSGCAGAGECLNKVSMTKNNIISALKPIGAGCPATANNLTVVFRRPDSSAIISSNPALPCTITSFQIIIATPKGTTASITLYPSGRVQIN
jgi:prepilin-type N-terminal cleavage/methylation domain-containing protein